MIQRKSRNSASLAFLGESTDQQWIPFTKGLYAERVSMSWYHYETITYSLFYSQWAALVIKWEYDYSSKVQIKSFGQNVS